MKNQSQLEAKWLSNITLINQQERKNEMAFWSAKSYSNV